MSNDSWDAARYALEKRKFIAARLRYRFIGAHTWMIFTATWAAGWGVSGLLLAAGMKNMPLRYGLALAASYPVFFLCVRLWANVVRDTPTADNRSYSDFADYLNAPVDGEGCLFALVVLLLGGLLAGIFALLGGPELLLEAAFEVVFAGTMVRRLRHLHVVGNWKVRLLRNTAPFAVAVMVGLVAIAAGLQNRVPGATTFAQACRVLYSQSAHSHSRPLGDARSLRSINNMWKRIALLDSHNYVLNLCQDEEGRRFCVVTEAQVTPPCTIRQTEEIPVALLRSYDGAEISRRFRLKDGSGFIFGPHGEWFTHEEVDSLNRGDPNVPWITSCPPLLPPR